MSPFWEQLDKIGIVLGILVVIVDIFQTLWMWKMSDDMEDTQDDVEDIKDELEDE